MGGRRNTHSLLHFMYLHTLQDVKIDFFFVLKLAFWKAKFFGEIKRLFVISDIRQ